LNQPEFLIRKTVCLRSIAPADDFFLNKNFTRDEFIPDLYHICYKDYSNMIKNDKEFFSKNNFIV